MNISAGSRSQSNGRVVDASLFECVGSALPRPLRIQKLTKLTDTAMPACHGPLLAVLLAYADVRRDAHTLRTPRYGIYKLRNEIVRFFLLFRKNALT